MQLTNTPSNGALLGPLLSLLSLLLLLSTSASAHAHAHAAPAAAPAAVAQADPEHANAPLEARWVRSNDGTLYCGNFHTGSRPTAAGLLTDLDLGAGGKIARKMFTIGAGQCNRVHCWGTTGVYVCNVCIHALAPWPPPPPFCFYRPSSSSSITSTPTPLLLLSQHKYSPKYTTRDLGTYLHMLTPPPPSGQLPQPHPRREPHLEPRQRRLQELLHRRAVGPRQPPGPLGPEVHPPGRPQLQRHHRVRQLQRLAQPAPLRRRRRRRQQPVQERPQLLVLWQHGLNRS